ncbi:MAG: cytochrome c oxidase accessory protein CcoG [Chitinophagales bacterium]
MAENTEKEDFRDSISTVDKSGKRIWVFPKKPFGRYFNARAWLSYFLLIFFFTAPFIHINGQPLLMLNIFERKFVIFTFPFWPQDFFVFVLAMITLIVFIVLFTVVYGRLFCGWVCPQTIFMEMFFRRIEYWIEGDANQQRKLDKQEWNRDKIIKKGGKHIIFLVSAFAIGNTFMAYLVGREKWLQIVTSSPIEHLAGFFGVIVFSMAFYGVFAFLREQVCTTICPYGRLQGVLLDRDSIVIAYDWLRGEPRGKLKKNEPDPNLGDCIDCNLCVQVCPTGIDIRNGTQLECINCTACIDACDHVMDKIDKPRGLIRYASYNNIAEKKPFAWSPRMLGYTGVLIVLLFVLTGALLTRTSVETTLLRAPGTLFRESSEGNISNIYTLQMVNKTSQTFEVELKLEGIDGKVTVAGGTPLVEAQSMYDGAVVIEIPKEKLESRKNKIQVGVYRDGKSIDIVKTQFLAP